MLMIVSLLMAVQAQPAPDAAKSPAADKLVCRTVQEIHSRIPSRVCRRKSEWDEMARVAQDDMKSSRNDRHIPPN